MLRFRYQTVEFGKLDIHLRTLRDSQQFSDPEGIAENVGIHSATWPLFGVLWESGKVLAGVMTDFDIEGKRILEVGCGIGLASLVLNSREADITATDHHPEADGYLRWNTYLNGGEVIPFVQTAWSDPCDQLGIFDLVIGSDLLYEPDQPALLADFIADHTATGSEVVLVDPARGNFSRFSSAMKVHDFARTESLQPRQTFKGQVARFMRVVS